MTASLCGGSRSARADGVLPDDARPLPDRLDGHLSGKLLFHRLDVADDTHRPAARAELVELVLADSGHATIVTAPV